jgi:hypothetical protein
MKYGYNLIVEEKHILAMFKHMEWDTSGDMGSNVELTLKKMFGEDEEYWYVGSVLADNPTIEEFNQMLQFLLNRMVHAELESISDLVKFCDSVAVYNSSIFSYAQLERGKNYETFRNL